jgi:hypothetical protein
VIRLVQQILPTALRQIMPSGLRPKPGLPGIQDVVRYARVGFDRPKASDQCPVAVTIKI